MSEFPVTDESSDEVFQFKSQDGRLGDNAVPTDQEFVDSEEDASEATGAQSADEIIQDPQPEPDPEPVPDTRLYLPEHDEWQVHIKRDSEKMYCYAKLPGEDWFHMLLNGEIYVSRQHEKYCLRCALRLGFLTDDRLFWQHRVPKRRHGSM